MRVLVCDDDPDVGPMMRMTFEMRGCIAELVTSGEWAFSDDDLADVAASILKEHAETFGGVAQNRAVLILSPFPKAAGADRWSAETRGDSVVLLSGRSPSKVWSSLPWVAPSASLSPSASSVCSC